MATPKKLHITMFPWLAFGHMLPFFELAKHIAGKDHKVFFISTPKNIERLPKIPPNLSPFMNFVSLTLPHQDNLPQDAEATTDLPFSKVQYLKMSYDKLQDSLTQFLQTCTPDWIIKQHNPVELPDGFEERVEGRGVVWTSWAPQLKILSHESVGAFLTHCGLNSIIEALHYGRPLVLLHFVMDHGLVSRVFAEKKAGIEIERNEEDGVYTRKSVAETLRMVIVEEEGRVYRDKAKEMRIIIADKQLQNQYADNFVEFLQTNF
ncbi:putative UDP-rhamnose:rhamnosyltransferase 1 [Pistacia vera]|uniref:putative UDP-rhamnose:rhamnosyltransferase 1 n=1 Tax=Pistacia vera TaxID=55513 RepID=UPI0012634623|nr:putative UDP-rhamnose:rhamnosyltransferase 1 [Pistacia vera]